MDQHAIEISHLRKTYGDVVAVDDLSLRVPGGCIFGFLGPNGAGKTTTVGCLSGVLAPTRGEIRLCGQPFTTDSVALKRVLGVMPDTLGLFDALYAQEFLEFVARMYGLDRATARRRGAELLDALALSGESRKPLADFSTGMRKRVAFAAAVIHAPDLLFLDEPFEGIDPAGVALIKGWLRRLADAGRTVFITSHVLDTVERLCDRVAIVRSPGALLWEGEIAAALAETPIVLEDKAFRTLEALYLHVTGGTTPRALEWL